MKAQTSRLFKHVELLTEIHPPRQYQNQISLAKVADYIDAEFVSYGMQTERQWWKAEGVEYCNVIASYQPEKKKRLIVGAHYDVCGDQPGADDNASAVAGLLETARLIMEELPKLDFRDRFCSV